MHQPPGPTPADGSPGRTAAARPTLLVFTLGAAREAARRPLLPRARREAELALRETCLAAALDAGREAGCRLAVSAPEATLERLRLEPDTAGRAQIGRGFGERLERACAAALTTDGPLLVVGSDTPGLTAHHLRQTVDLLADDPQSVVLGPSPDGGFYLLAAARPIAGLAGLTRWCRPDTLKLLRRSLRARGHRVVLLAPLVDLDRRGDLETWLATARRGGESFGAGGPTLWRSLLRRLRQVLDELRRAVSVEPTRLRPQVAVVHAARPPPRRPLG